MRLLESLLLDRVADPDYVGEDDRPTTATVDRSRDIITQLRDKDAAEAEIGFFAGEIHIDWEDSDRHVIAMVIGQSLKVYWSRLENKRVIESGCKGATVQELNERLDWMREGKGNTDSPK